MEFGKRVNLHTHTDLCKHAEGKIADYCRETLKQGIRVLGFSDHCPLPNGLHGDSRMELSDLPGYVAELEAARLQFPELTILSGLEVDYFQVIGKAFYEDLFLDKYAMDYLIAGTHFLEPSTPDTCLWLSGTRLNDRNAQRFVRDSIRTMETGMFTFFNHPDLFTCCYPDWTPDLEAVCKDLLEAASALKIPLEINAYGLRKQKIMMSDGTLRAPYPNLKFWELAANYPIRTVANSDAHKPTDVWGNTDDAIQIGKDLGLKPVENAEVAEEIILRKKNARTAAPSSK